MRDPKVVSDSPRGVACLGAHLSLVDNRQSRLHQVSLDPIKRILSVASMSRKKNARVSHFGDLAETRVSDIEVSDERDAILTITLQKTLPSPSTSSGIGCSPTT